MRRPAYAIQRSCENKSEVVVIDEREEHGQRALLNLGHTFGHAIELDLGLAHGCMAKRLQREW